jgi:hypothetical protein
MSQQQKIAIFVPKGLRTGGPEAMHQLHYELLQQNQASFLVARPGTSRNDSVAEYSIYQPRWISILKLRRKDLIIVPCDLDRLPFWYLLFLSPKNCFNWMLAVDFCSDSDFRRYESKNYPLPKEWRKIRTKNNLLHRFLNKITAPFKIYKRDRRKTFRFKLKIDKRNYLFQSAYARATYEFIFKINAGHMLTDYININDYKGVSTYNLCKCHKKHIAYFPSKSQSEMELLFKVNVDNRDKLHFIPVKNLTKGEMIVLLSTSDCYLDLGFFPGRDRLPREAILLDCPVLLARRGSARYHEDFPIPDQYLLDLGKLTPELVFEKILNHLTLPKNTHLKAQADFKNTVTLQKDLFQNEVKDLLNYIKIFAL